MNKISTNIPDKSLSNKEKVKLDNPFTTNNTKKEEESKEEKKPTKNENKKSDLFKNLSFFVDVNCNSIDESDRFKCLLEDYGAKIAFTKSIKECDYLVFKDGKVKNLEKALNKNIKIVESAWILKCINEMKIVDESKYLITVSYSDFHLNHRFYKKKTINGKLDDIRETKSLSTEKIIEKNIEVSNSLSQNNEKINKIYEDNFHIEKKEEYFNIKTFKNSKEKNIDYKSLLNNTIFSDNYCPNNNNLKKNKKKISNKIPKGKSLGKLNDSKNILKNLNKFDNKEKEKEDHMDKIPEINLENINELSDSKNNKFITLDKYFKRQNQNNPINVNINITNVNSGPNNTIHNYYNISSNYSKNKNLENNSKAKNKNNEESNINPFKNFDFSTLKSKRSLNENQNYYPCLSMIKERKKITNQQRMTSSKERMNAFDLNLRERLKEKNAKKNITNLKDFLKSRNESETRINKNYKYPFMDKLEYSNLENKTQKVSKSMSRDFNSEIDPEFKNSFSTIKEIRKYTNSGDNNIIKIASIGLLQAEKVVLKGFEISSKNIKVLVGEDFSDIEKCDILVIRLRTANINDLRIIYSYLFGLLSSENISEFFNSKDNEYPFEKKVVNFKFFELKGKKEKFTLDSFDEFLIKNDEYDFSKIRRYFKENSLPFSGFKIYADNSLYLNDLGIIDKLKKNIIENLIRIIGGIPVDNIKKSKIAILEKYEKNTEFPENVELYNLNFLIDSLKFLEIPNKHLLQYRPSVIIRRKKIK